MTSLQIRKEIERATKRIKIFRLEVILWHGDSMEFEGDAVYNEILIIEGLEGYENMLDINLYFGDDMEENDINISILKKEQKKMYNYLKKNFEHVTMKEENI